jgi:Type IV secretion system pilin
LTTSCWSDYDKSKMKKLTSVSLSFSALFLSFASFADAQTLCPPGRFASLCNLKINNGSNIIGSILTTLLIVAAIISLFFLIWGGIRWIMSGGDKGKIDQARGTITAALVGLVIAFLAFFIVSIVSYFFTGQTGFNFAVPTLVP